MNWQKHLQTAEGYLELGLLDRAAREIESVSPEEKSLPEILSFRMGLFLAAKNWNGAATLAKHLVKRDPSRSDWWIHYAYAIRRHCSITEAEEILLEAAKLHPSNATIHYNLACYAAQTGRFALAKERLSRAIEIEDGYRLMALEDPDFAPLWRAL